MARPGIPVCLAFPAILVLALGALAFALIAQYGFGFQPCLLCQYQRIPYWTVAVLAGAGLLVPGLDRRGTAFVIAAVFAGGAMLAGYHVGVEQHWWQAGACAAQGGLPLSFEAFRGAPLAPIAKPCDAVDWTLFGLSMATYNAVLSSVLAVGTVVVARSLPRG